MVAPIFAFEDGEAYERGMGAWSQLVAPVFLDWLNTPPGLKWIDVGCGNGAFTEMLVNRCAPAEVQAIDPSEGQLGFARTRPAARVAVFQQGDAMALPFEDNRFDAATMALVIFFVPDPAKGVAEMVRVVTPGGLVATYVWDTLNGGFPWEPIQAEMRAMGVPPPSPPSVEASRMESLLTLWPAAGLEAIESRQITVQRTFTDFEDFWISGTKMRGGRSGFGSLTEAQIANLKSRVQASLVSAANGQIVCSARVNAIRGRKPT